jgi:hypothetical protein
MDQKYNTSFIPKKFLSEDVQSGSTSKYIKRRSIVGPGYFISVLLFIATTVSSVGLFIYTRIIDTAVQEKIDSLTTAMQELKAEDLDEFAELDKQMDVAQNLLDNHVAVTELLHSIEKRTLQDVQYVALAFLRQVDPEPAVVDLNGKTRTLAYVASQAREFEAESNLVGSALRTLGQDDQGMYAFGIHSAIASDLISYAIAVREERHGKETRATSLTPPASPNVSSPLQ